MTRNGTYTTAIAIAESASDLESWRALCASAASVSDLHEAAVESFTLEQVHESSVVTTATGKESTRKGESLAWTRVRRELSTDPALARLFDAAGVDLESVPESDRRAAASMQRHARTMLRMLGRAFRERLDAGQVFAHELGGGRFVVAFPQHDRESAFDHAARVRPVSESAIAGAIESAIIRPANVLESGE